uniref:Uncharacterized protein n=1 Tax=Vespula pensylvanica TaxID=30213 RepID=A0A834K550_VESPE|nr:hypothetical protein H0235_015973 [Vespula pensylvanica]
MLVPVPGRQTQKDYMARYSQPNQSQCKFDVPVGLKKFKNNILIATTAKLKLMLRDTTRCMFPNKGEIRKSYHYRKVYDFTVRKGIGAHQQSDSYWASNYFDYSQ